MKVGELRKILADVDDDTKVVVLVSRLGASIGGARQCSGVVGHRRL